VLDTTTRVDFNASYTLPAGTFEGLELFARVYNAFDEKEYFSISGHPGFTNTIGPPGKSRSGIRYKFGQ